MKSYQSHKVVEAERICGYSDQSIKIVYLNSDEVVTVPDDFFSRGYPSMGDYLVRYAPDGYLSWSPRAAFEAGYTLVEDKPSTWQERAVLELNELGARIESLRNYLVGWPDVGSEALALMQTQYKAMTAYHDALSMRLRVCGVIDTETPPEVREYGERREAFTEISGIKQEAWDRLRGTPACVEVTVTAPAGKRAHVAMDHANEKATKWTVTEGQRQSWSLVGDEVLMVAQEDTSTVAHKRPAG